MVTLATRAWRVTRKLGDFGRERESAWRITRKHWKELERKWAGWQEALHRSILEKYCKKELHLDRLVRL